MYGEPAWREVRRLGAEGMPKTRIAQRLGMSRNTVAKLLRLQEPPRFKGRVQLTSREDEVLRRFRATAHRASARDARF